MAKSTSGRAGGRRGGLAPKEKKLKDAVHKVRARARANDRSDERAMATRGICGEPRVRPSGTWATSRGISFSGVNSDIIPRKGTYDRERVSYIMNKNCFQRDRHDKCLTTEFIREISRKSRCSTFSHGLRLQYLLQFRRKNYFSAEGLFFPSTKPNPRRLLLIS